MAPPASVQLRPWLLKATAWCSSFCPTPHLSIGGDTGTALLARILLCATPPSIARWNSFAGSTRFCATPPLIARGDGLAQLHPFLCDSTPKCWKGRLGSAPPSCVQLHPWLLSGTASTLFCATPPLILGRDSLPQFHPLLWDSTLDSWKGWLGGSTLFCGTPPLILGRDGLVTPPSSLGLRPWALAGTTLLASTLLWFLSGTAWHGSTLFCATSPPSVC